MPGRAAKLAGEGRRLLGRLEPRSRHLYRRLHMVGSRVYVDESTVITTPEMAIIEDDVYVGPGGYIAADGGLRIGRGVMIGPLVYVQTSTHNFESPDLLALPYDHRIVRRPVCIQRYAWLGGRVTVLPGVTIGEGAVVGAGSVVAADVPRLAIAVGNPARVMRYRDPELFGRIASSGVTHAQLTATGDFNDTWIDDVSGD